MNLILGIENDVKFFTIKIKEKKIEEQRGNNCGCDDLKNIYAIVNHDEKLYTGGDNGVIYVFNEENKLAKKFNASNVGLLCLTSIYKNGKSYLLTIAEDNKIQLWLGEDMAESLEIFDEEMRIKLGTENL